MSNVIFSVRSETGLVRSNNEDNFYCDGEILTRPENSFSIMNRKINAPCIFAVCDGMGGESCGEKASLTAIKTLGEHAAEIKSATMSLTQNFNININEAVQNFISDANNKLCRIMRENAFRMGTTIALVVISDGNEIQAYNIGDSRIYKLQDEILSLISKDHTIAQQKIKMGLITPEEARHDKSRHILTRCLGIFEDEMILTADVISPFLVNDRNKSRLLLCSDGLTDMLPDSRIHELMLENHDSCSAVNALVDQALNNGGRDNITCIIIDIIPEGE